MHRDKYYVSNPLSTELWVEDNLVPEFAVRKLIPISYKKAVELKGLGWTVVKQDEDSESGIAPVATSASVPFSREIGDEESDLALSDVNKFIRVFDNGSLFVPRDSDINFEMGSIVTLVATDGFGVRPKTYDDEGDQATVVLTGTEGNDSSYWILQEGSINTLMKVDENLWYLSGPNIVED